jgi:hypothetical protein
MELRMKNFTLKALASQWPWCQACASVRVNGKQRQGKYRQGITNSTELALHGLTAICTIAYQTAKQVDSQRYLLHDRTLQISQTLEKRTLPQPGAVPLPTIVLGQNATIPIVNKEEKK